MNLLNKIVQVTEDLLLDLTIEGASMATLTIMEEAIPNIVGEAVRYHKEVDSYTVKTTYRCYQQHKPFHYYTIEAKYLEEAK